MTILDFRNWKTTPLGTHNYAEITLNGQWDSYEDAARKAACICEFEAAEPPSDMVTLTFVSAFDNDNTKDVSKYRVHMRLNGNLVYSGTPAVDHARLEGGNIVNFKGLEVKFDRAYLRAGRNLLKVSLTNVEKKHWFAWDSIKIDGTPYEPSPQRWQLYSPTDVDGVYGGETYNFIFDAP